MSARARHLFLVAIASLGTSACALFGSTPPPAEPCKTVPLELYVRGSNDQNPNAEGQSLPVEIRVFVLSQREAFDQLSVTELLSENKDPELEKAVLQRSAFTLMPGEERIVPLNVAKEAAYVGLVGNFRRLEPGQGQRVVEVTRAVERCKAGQLSVQIPTTVRESRLTAPERVE